MNGVSLIDQQLEIEFKNMLTNEEFTAIKNHFRLTSDDFLEQKNFYFETPHFALASKQSALRIRKKGDQYKLTLKQPHQDGLLETNLPLQKQEAIAFIQANQFPSRAIKIKAILSSLTIDIEKLACIGYLTTYRAEFPYKDGLIALDHSYYLGIEDYEIEYEVKDKKTGFEYFNALLKQLNIEKKPTNNKIKRFYDEKERQTLK